MSDHQLPHDHGGPFAHGVHSMPSPQDFAVVADVFKKLDDCNRLRIFWVLCHCEECVINISALVEMSSPAVSHHLRQLKDAGLIVSRREGKEVYYRAADSQQAQTLHAAIEQIMAITCPR